jgi:SMC interacting uncharacterized protein involved in chromosome segregation
VRLAGDILAQQVGKSPTGTRSKIHTNVRGSEVSYGRRRRMRRSIKDSVTKYQL